MVYIILPRKLIIHVNFMHAPLIWPIRRGLTTALMTKWWRSDIAFLESQWWLCPQKREVGAPVDFQGCFWGSWRGNWGRGWMRWSDCTFSSSLRRRHQPDCTKLPKHKSGPPKSINSPGVVLAPFIQRLAADLTACHPRRGGQEGGLQGESPERGRQETQEEKFSGECVSVQTFAAGPRGLSANMFLHQTSQICNSR